MIAVAALTAAIADAASAGQGSARTFSRTLKKNDVTFAVSSSTDGGTSTVGVTASASGQTTSASRSIDGSVTRAEVADLDGDLTPEVYVWVQSDGSGSYGTLVGYVADKQAALSEISLQPIEGDARVSDGYMGHDEFRILRSTNAMIRRFPLYKPGDANSKPTGGRRTLYYALEKDGTGWALRVVRVVNESR